MTREIQLTKGHVALVDDEDYDRVMAAGRWYARPDSNTTYAAHTLNNASKGQRFITERLHTFLTGWAQVDHINLDGLDNRRSNLRQATRAQNSANRPRQANNTSGFKGVSWYKRNSKWLAQIQISRRTIWLGYHSNPEDAARAYDVAARELFGEFAYLNFPNPDERSAR